MTESADMLFDSGSSHWKTSEIWPEIGSDEVHLWRVRLDGIGYQDQRLTRLLSDEEQARAQRFLFDRHRDRFIRTHAICRKILSGYTGIPPEQIVFGATTRGKPFLQPAPNRLHINLSHSGDLMIMGVAVERDLGVDVEVINNEVEWRQIAQNYFNDYEMKAIASFPTKDKQLQAFYRVWTLKEAYLKAIGEGLAGGLDQVVVNLDKESDDLFLAFPGGENEKRRWQANLFRPASGACGAVIAQRNQLSINLIQFDWKDEEHSEA